MPLHSSTYSSYFTGITLLTSLSFCLHIQGKYVSCQFSPLKLWNASFSLHDHSHYLRTGHLSSHLGVWQDFYYLSPVLQFCHSTRKSTSKKRISSVQNLLHILLPQPVISFMPPPLHLENSWSNYSVPMLLVIQEAFSQLPGMPLSHYVLPANNWTREKALWMHPSISRTMYIVLHIHTE